jgi:hypothetical protein
MAATAGGEYAPAVGTARTDAPLPDDPRVVRPLPWVPHSWSSDAPSGIFPRIVIGASIFLLTLRGCAVRRRWRSVAAWLVVFLLATVAATVLFPRDDAQYMDPMEHYTWSGWYRGFYFGMFVAGGLVVQWFMVVFVWRLMHGSVGRLWARVRGA